ncbi:MAG: class I SAM-dependent methyltransferase [Fimbriimonadaceae bacterium]|nr:class I SAM-dependent methyltransferase [Fimbriimonadaceae bacterium]
MSVYDDPTAYDVAYAYRDFVAEVDFLGALTLGRQGHLPRRAVELAAGPARHGRELARRGCLVWTVDHNPGAAAWLRQHAPELRPVTADLRSFTLPEPVDLAFCPLAGFAYLLDDEAWQAALAATAAALLPGGVMLLELVPGDAERVAPTSWQHRLDGLTVTATAGPLRRVGEVYEWELHLAWSDAAGEHERVGLERQRHVPAALAERLVRRSGWFRDVRLYGDWDLRRRWRGDATVVLVASRRPTDEPGHAT